MRFIGFLYYVSICLVYADIKILHKQKALEKD